MQSKFFFPAVLLSGCLSLTAQSAPAQQELDQAREYLRGGMLTSAMDSYKKALKIEKGNCIPCLRGMYTTAVQEEDPKAAAAAAAQMEKLATDDATRAEAARLHAEALMPRTDQDPDNAKVPHPHPTRGQMEEAEAAWKRALAANPNDLHLQMMDGRALALAGHDAEARAVFEKISGSPDASEGLKRRAARFASNVDLARQPVAPGFTITTKDGRKISLDDLSGKIVLLDFWATWCGPCRNEISYIHSIANDSRFADSVVLISSSWDEKESQWQRFIQENDMTWAQYLDKKQTLSDAYHVSAIPTYVLIDADGVVRHRVTGGDFDLRSQVRPMVEELKRRNAAATDTAKR